MPIYEYRRPDGSTFEVMQSFSDDPLTHDPETGVEVQRVLHAPAVHFKGSGFYNTDYGTRRRQRENAASGDSGSGAGGGSDGDKAGAGEKSSSESSTPAKAESGGSDKSASAAGKSDSTAASAVGAG